MEWQIGEFSVMTRLTVKTLRYYHEEGLLIPSRIDAFTGYRYYDTAQAETAHAITTLRDFGFTIAEIRAIVAECGEDGDLLPVLRNKTREMRETAKELRDKERRLEGLLAAIEGEKYMNATEKIEVRECAEERVLTIRFKGRYDECGKYFGKLFQAAGGQVKGGPFCLYHDPEYKEDGADIEAGVPVKKDVKVAGTECKVIPAGKAVVGIHKGPYDTLHLTYTKLAEYAKLNGLETAGPVREIYLKGPGMIFSGNPKNYVTEIRIPVA